MHALKFCANALCSDFKRNALCQLAFKRNIKNMRPSIWYATAKRILSECGFLLQMAVTFTYYVFANERQDMANIPAAKRGR